MTRFLQFVYLRSVSITILFVVCFSFFLNTLPVAQAASPPNTFAYQGRVLNSNGVPVSDASASMKFEIYDADTGGTCLWSNSSGNCDSDDPSSTTARSVTLSDGLFSVRLGDTSDSWAAINDTIFADNANLYLQVYIEGEALSPRKAIDSVPYASNAENLDGLSSGDFDLDRIYDNDSDSILNVDSSDLEFSLDSTGLDFIVDLQSDGDFVLQDSGSAFFTVADDRSMSYTSNQTTSTVATWTFDQLTTGTGLSISLDGLTTGKGVDIASTSSSMTSGKLLSATHAATYTSGTTAYSGTGMELARSLVADGATTTLNISGSVLHLSSDASTANGGTVNETGPLFRLTQNNTSATGSSLYINADHTAGSALEIDSEATTGDVFTLSGEALTTGSALKILGSDMTDDSGVLIELDSAETNAAADLITLQSDVGSVGNDVFRIEANGSVYTNNAFVAGTGTTTIYTDAYISSQGDLLIELTGGDLTFGQNTVIGDGADAITLNSDGTLNIDDTVLAASGALTIQTAASGDLILDSASDIVSTVAGDDFAVGNTGLAAAFSIDESANLLRLGDGTGSNASVNMYSSGGDVGALSYTTSDAWEFSGGNVSIDGTSATGSNSALTIASNVANFVATFTNDGNADTQEGVVIQGCLDTNPTSACNFIEFRDGNGTVLGAIEGNGSGAVTTASAGSDYAELFPGVLSDFSEGDVLALNEDGSVELAADAGDVLGALSINPNTLGNWVENWEESGAYVPVALLGQVPVTVNTEGGSITTGDFLTLSSVNGVAKKASGVGLTIGRALEDHSAGTGTIMAYIQTGWHGGDALVDQNGEVGVQNGLTILGDDTSEISLHTEVLDPSLYELSFTNADDDEIATLNQDGDFALSGRLYPSDRGTMQTDKYIYYDGSIGSGGDFMRTNASGWGAGSYDFAEMFPSSDAVAAGEVVIFGEDNEHVMRSDGTIYDQRIAGIISTQPGFLAGKNIEGHVPVALSGRVPTYVTTENGSISIGDPLTTSSKPGYAMKATEPGQIIGYAMEPFSGKTGSIVAFVRASYYDGTTQEDVTQNVISKLENTSTLNLSGDVNLNGGSFLNVGTVQGIGQSWEIAVDGTIKTRGEVVQVVRSHQGEDVETYATFSREHTVELSGTVELNNGAAAINFEHEDPLFNDVIAAGVPYRVFLTADGPTGPLYAVNRDGQGFSIREVALGETRSTALVDWMVVAYHKDFAPDPEQEPKPDANEESQEDDEEEGVASEEGVDVQSTDEGTGETADVDTVGENSHTDVAEEVNVDVQETAAEQEGQEQEVQEQNAEDQAALESDGEEVIEDQAPVEEQDIPEEDGQGSELSNPEPSSASSQESSENTSIDSVVEDVSQNDQTSQATEDSEPSPQEPDLQEQDPVATQTQ